MHHRNYPILSASTIAACLLALPTANADTITWDSANATSTDWSLGTNWVDDIAPVAGDDVIITGDGSFAPTNNSGFASTTINSLTLTGSNTVSLGTTVQVGAGGVYNNMATGSLFLSAELTADQIWGGTRTIFVSGITGAGKMTFEGSAIRFDANSATWSAGLDVRTGVQMGGSFADSSVITPWGTGTISLINQLTDNTTSTNPFISLAAGAGNVSLATANTLANDIVLDDPGTGNFTIAQNNNASVDDANHHYILSGVISGDVDAARTLTFRNDRSGSAATFVLSGANTYNAQTTLDGSNPVTLALGNVDALQNSTLNTSGITVDRTVAFTVAGTNTYNLGGITGSGDLDIGANTISVGGNDESNSYDAVISGTGGLTKAGTGTQTLTGANTYTGATTISDGTLQLGNGGTTGTLSTSSSIANDGVLAINRSDAVVQGVDFSGDPITGTGSISNIGSGRLTLDGANTYSGGTNFTGDSLTVASEGALGTGAVVGDTSGSNAILTFNTSSDATFANDITTGASVGRGILNDSTTSVITLNGDVLFNDATTFQGFQGTGVNNAGFVIGGNVSSTTRLTLKDTNLTLAASGTLGPTFSSRITLGDVGGSGSAVYVEDGADFTLRVQDSQNTSITNDAMTFIVGMNTAGTGTFSSSDSVNLLANGSSVANDWEFLAVTDATVNFTGKIISNNANANAADVTVTKTGDGTVVFAQDNTYLGDTFINAGTLQIGDGGSTGSLSTSSTITNNGVLAFNTSSAISQGTDFSGDAITGTGAISNLGSGRLTLNTANTYSGGTSFVGNTLTVGAAGALGTGDITGTSNAVLTFDTASDVTFNNDITLATLSDTGLVNNSMTSTVTLGGTVELTSGFATLVGTGVDNAGFVIADGGVLKAGSSSRLGLKNTSLTIENGGSVDYSATGFKRITLAEAGGTGAAVYLGDGADLDMVIYDTNNGNVTSDTMNFVIGMKSAGTATFSGLSGEAVDLNHRNDASSLANEWEITAVAGATANFTGSIVNNNTNHQSTITKTGDGTVIFSADNTYTGETTVAAGTLQVDAIIASVTITVDDGASLTGSGTILGDAIVNGNLLPGNSPGIMTFGGDLTLGADSITTMEIDGSALRGTDYDGIDVGGTFTMDGQLVLDFGTTFEEGVYTFSLFDIAGDSGTFDSIVLAGAYTGGLTNIDDNLWQRVDGNNTWEFTESTGNLDLTVVPEPSSFALLAGCLALGSVIRRRRRA